jgi:hypothetical protein
MSAAGEEEEFAFAFDSRFRRPLALAGVRPSRASVRLTADDRLVVRFGPWRLETPIANVCDVVQTRDYRWFKAIGARGSFADRGVTFGTNTERGACTCFLEPVPALLPGHLLRHPGMTVTLEDCDGFEAALRRRMA